MRYLFFLMLLPLGACVPVQESYYIPADKTYLYEGYACGAVPYGGYRRNLDVGASIYLRVIPNKEELGIILEIALEKDSSLRFIEQKFSLLGSNNAVIDVVFNEKKDAGYNSVDLSKEILGSSDGWFIADSKVSNFSSDKFYFSVPKLSLNGKEIYIEPIEFLKVKKSGFIACLQ